MERAKTANAQGTGLRRAGVVLTIPSPGGRIPADWWGTFEVNMKTRTLLLPATAFVAFAVTLSPSLLGAGENRDVRLAMHCVPASDYLECPDVSPQSCEEIDCDLTPEELLSSGGAGTIFLVAYNVNSLAGVEFALTFPSGSGSMFDGPHWCARTALVIPSPGAVRSRGGIVSWGRGDFCLEPASPGGGVIFGYLEVDFTGSSSIVVEYAPSTYTYGFDPRNYTLDCSTSFEEDRVVHHHGAVINGVGRSTIGDPCEGGPVSDISTWSTLKSLYRE